MSKLGHGAIATYSKNLLRSSSEILLDWIKSTQLVQIVGDEVVSAKKARELEGDITPKEKIKKLTKNQIESFVKNYEDETGINLPEDLKKSFRNTIKSIKTGNLNIKDEAYDEFYEDDDIRALFKELDIAYESYDYFKGGNKLMKLYELKNENLKKLRIRANGESMEIQGPIPEVNKEIIEIKDDIIALDNEAASNEDIDSTYTMNVDSTVNDLKGRIFDLMDKTSGVKELAVSYKDAFADSLIALLSVKSNFDLNVADRPAEEVLNNTETLAAEITEKTNNDDKINDRVEEVKEVTNTDADSLIFNPIIDATAQEVTGEEPVPVAEGFKEWVDKIIRKDLNNAWIVNQSLLTDAEYYMSSDPKERIDELTSLYKNLTKDIKRKQKIETIITDVSSGIYAVITGLAIAAGQKQKKKGTGTDDHVIDDKEYNYIAVTSGLIFLGMTGLGIIMRYMYKDVNKAIASSNDVTGDDKDYLESLKKLKKAMTDAGETIDKGRKFLVDQASKKDGKISPINEYYINKLEDGLAIIKSDKELVSKEITAAEANIIRNKVPVSEGFKEWFDNFMEVDLLTANRINNNLLDKIQDNMSTDPKERVKELIYVYSNLLDDIEREVNATKGGYKASGWINALIAGFAIAAGKKTNDTGLKDPLAKISVGAGILALATVTGGLIFKHTSKDAINKVKNATTSMSDIGDKDYLESLKTLKKTMSELGNQINKGVVRILKSDEALSPGEELNIRQLQHGLAMIKADIELVDKEIAIESNIIRNKVPQAEGIKDLAGGVAKNAAATASIAAVATLLIAIPVNLAIQKRNIKNESKFKSNFTFKQPLISSDQISAEFVSKYAKAIEIKSLIEAKALIESSIATADGGSVVSRATRNNMLTPANITPKNIELFKKAPINYDELMATFSEAKPFIKKLNTDSLFLVPSLSSVVRRHAESFKVITDIKVPEASGEAGTFLATGRNAHPTYLDIEVMYKDPSDLTKLGGGTNTKKSTLGFHVIPRTLKSNDIMTTIKEMGDFEDMKVLNGERESQKKLSNVIKFWKKKGTGKEKAVLSSNSFSAIIEKIENVKNPLFHLVISYGEYMDLKENGKMDLMDRATYRKLLNSMPIISISIIDEERDVVYLSEGSYMSYTKHDGSDFIDSISQYEKDLKTIIKYNQYQ